MSSNSTTTTATWRLGPVAPVSFNLFKPQIMWPNPVDSIDFSFPALVERERTKLGQLVEQYFWTVNGPAQAAYVSIQEKIQSCLSCRDDLFEGECESSLPSGIECYMVGRRPEKASPYIAVSCSSEKYCRKVISIIKATD